MIILNVNGFIMLLTWHVHISIIVIMLGYVMCLVFYTVSAKNILDIFDCNLKTNYQISIIF